MTSKPVPVPSRSVPFEPPSPPTSGNGTHPEANGQRGADVSPQVDHLLQEARRGSAESFASLYERFHGPVFRFLLARVGNRIEAEDMASEVFVEAARRVRRFDGDGVAFVGWLFTIARHDLLDRGRAQRRRVVVPVPDVPEVEVVPDPADRVAELMDAARVREALETLTPEQRDVVLLKFASGLSNAEVAKTLGKPVGAVKSLQHRGLAALKRLLEKAER
jgi:RNA polymerase sigma-70 factor (ECF subfamily)